MIQFDEKEHKYTKDNVEYISVTTLISRYVPNWDPKGEITARCAIKNGITPREQADLWEQKANIAADYGTEIHSFADSILKGSNIDYNLLLPLHKLIIDICKELKKEYLSSEKIIWDEDLLIAGTVDLLTQDKEGNITIWDWKTNEKPIEIDNKYNKYLLPPLDKVPNNNYYKYALQLSLYRYLLEIQKQKVIGIKLIHLTNNSFKEITLPYLKEEVELMLKHYKENKEVVKDG